MCFLVFMVLLLDLGLGLEMKEKTHAPSPSTSGKTHEKTSVIQTRRLQFDVSYYFLAWSKG